MVFDLTEVRNDRIEFEILRLQEFIEERLFSDIEADSIEVRFDTEVNLDADGFCTQEDDDSYLIEISTQLRGEDLIRTLIHELVHVRQYLLGSLEQIHVDGKGPRMYWNSKDMTDRSYDDRPWEIEAHGVEYRLCSEFLSLQ